jgi:hypothetical protein
VRIVSGQHAGKRGVLLGGSTPGFMALQLPGGEQLHVRRTQLRLALAAAEGDYAPPPPTAARARVVKRKGHAPAPAGAPSACEGCAGRGGGKLLACTVCHLAWHEDCLRPPRRLLLREARAWLCDTCERAQARAIAADWE